jgi:hypothetical protein
MEKQYFEFFSQVPEGAGGAANFVKSLMRVDGK